MKTIIVLSALATFVFACTSDTDEPNKSDYRNSDRADIWVTDRCEEYGWYDDLECDSFCPNPDPDCESEVDCRLAFVVPHCTSGVLVEQEACAAAEDRCTTTEGLCGVISRCIADEEPTVIDCRLAFVVPHCESGALVEEAACEAAGDHCITTEGLCGVISRCI